MSKSHSDAEMEEMATKVIKNFEQDSESRTGFQCLNKCGKEMLLHQRRSRKFLIIIACVVIPIMCSICRYRCPVCGKTRTKLPKGASRHKRYLPLEVAALAAQYVEQEDKTYRSVAGTGKREHTYGNAVPAPAPVPAAPFGEEQEEEPDVLELNYSTLWRWVGHFGRLDYTNAVSIALQIQPSERFHAEAISPSKYRSTRRVKLLERCRKLLRSWRIIKGAQGFTNFATRLIN